MQRMDPHLRPRAASWLESGISVEKLSSPRVVSLSPSSSSANRSLLGTQTSHLALSPKASPKALMPRLVTGLQVDTSSDSLRDFERSPMRRRSTAEDTDSSFIEYEIKQLLDQTNLVLYDLSPNHGAPVGRRRVSNAQGPLRSPVYSEDLSWSQRERRASSLTSSLLTEVLPSTRAPKESVTDRLLLGQPTSTTSKVKDSITNILLKATTQLHEDAACNSHVPELEISTRSEAQPQQPAIAEDDGAKCGSEKSPVSKQQFDEVFNTYVTAYHKLIAESIDEKDRDFRDKLEKLTESAKSFEGKFTQLKESELRWQEMYATSQKRFENDFLAQERVWQRRLQKTVDESTDEVRVLREAQQSERSCMKLAVNSQLGDELSTLQHRYDSEVADLRAQLEALRQESAEERRRHESDLLQTEREATASRMRYQNQIRTLISKLRMQERNGNDDSGSGSDDAGEIAADCPVKSKADRNPRTSGGNSSSSAGRGAQKSSHKRNAMRRSVSAATLRESHSGSNPIWQQRCKEVAMKVVGVCASVSYLEQPFEGRAEVVKSSSKNLSGGGLVVLSVDPEGSNVEAVTVDKRRITKLLKLSKSILEMT